MTRRLTDYMAPRGYATEARQRCEAAFDAVKDAEQPEYAACQLALVSALVALGDQAAVRRVSEEVLTRVRRAAGPLLVDGEPAEYLRTEALQVSALSAENEGDPVAARALYEEALETAVDPDFRGRVLSNYASFLYAHDVQRAYELCREAATLGEETRNELLLANAYHNGAYCLLDLGRPVEARKAMRENYPRVAATRAADFLAVFAEDYASVMQHLGHTRSACVLLGSARALRERSDIAQAPQQRALVDKARVVLESELGESATQAWKRGESLTIEQAVEMADRLADSHDSSSAD
jgi:tetratricopeptide (TPR) repeat protein